MIVTRWTFVAIILILGYFTNITPAAALSVPKEILVTAKVVSIIDEGVREVAGYAHSYQAVEVLFLSGLQTGEKITIDHGGTYDLTQDQRVKVGETVVVNQVTNQGETQYWIVDKYRLATLAWLVGGFFLVVTLMAGRKGVGAIVGMVVSLGVIVTFIVPQILGGRDPLMISLAGALVILFVTMYLAHGFQRQTTIAVAATLGSLIVTGLAALAVVGLTRLTGLGSEDAYNLQLGPTQIINLKGLLLGSMIIGAIGVLDDITTSQVAAIFELKKANPKLTFDKLISQAKNIGTEHIASLVNTLVMAYAGAAMPIFIFLVLNPNQEPIWAMVNSELIAEEIVRTLVGSLGLIAAVPITTWLAAWYVSKRSISTGS